MSVLDDRKVHVAFVSSMSRVAPRCAIGMPQTELCAAVEAAKGATAITSELRRKPCGKYLYCDSMVVLGYLTNDQRRFSKYVERRVCTILDHTSQNDWHYVNTRNNPTDYSSRPTDVSSLMSSVWYKGPDLLWDPHYTPNKHDSTKVPIPLPEEDTKPITILLTNSAVSRPPWYSLFGRTKKFNR